MTGKNAARARMTRPRRAVRRAAALSERRARIASDVYNGLAEIRHVRRSLTDRPGRYHDAVHLEISAAQMTDGVGQGAEHYFTLPPSVGRKILDAAGRILRAEIARLRPAARRKPVRGKRTAKRSKAARPRGKAKR